MTVLEFDAAIAVLVSKAAEGGEATLVLQSGFLVITTNLCLPEGNPIDKALEPIEAYDKWMPTVRPGILEELAFSLQPLCSNCGKECPVGMSECRECDTNWWKGLE